MASDSGIFSGVVAQVGKRLSPPVGSEEETDSDNMVSVAKPTVEYDGYQRTITDVVRILQSKKEKDDTSVSQLMVGLDDAIKTCRSLRLLLERLHQRRNTDFYQQLNGGAAGDPIPSQ